MKSRCFYNVKISFIYIHIYILSLASIHGLSKTMWNMSLQTTSTILGGWVGFFIILSGQNPPKKTPCNCVKQNSGDPFWSG